MRTTIFIEQSTSMTDLKGAPLKFEDLKLSEPILRALTEKGYEKPFEIQENSIPVLLENEIDFVGQAQTGTGKTAAFVLPLLEKVAESFNHIQGLILAPTRELANQINEEIKEFSKYTKIKSLPVYGGVPIRDQIQDLRRKKPQILVGTPGRILDLVNRGLLHLDKTQYAVCDECDEMLNRGFIEDVKKILGLLSGNRKIWMFSATMPRPVLNMINEYLDKPKIVSVKKSTMSAQNIEQAHFLIPKRNMVKALCCLFDSIDNFYGIIFCRTKIDAKIVSEELASWGISCSALHGDMAQDQRTHTMNRFKKKEIKLLICTDVAARGIDVSDLTHVVNFGLPQDFESYVHRIGRTGRAGQKGIAYTFVSPDEKYKLPRLEKFIKSPIKRAVLPKVKMIKQNLLKRELVKLYDYEELEKAKDQDLYDLFKEQTKDEDYETLLKKMYGYISQNIFSNYKSEESLDLKEQKFATNDGPSFRNQKMNGEDHVRFFVNLGKNDGINLKSFLENIANGFSIKRKDLKNIVLKDDFSFVEVHKTLKTRILKGKKIFFKKKQVRFEVAKAPLKGSRTH